MIKPLSFFVLLLALGLPGRAAPTAVDLGDGLAYVQVHALADAGPVLNPALTGNSALVVDLRYASADATATAAFIAALARHATEVPLFILISPQTPADLARAANRAAGDCLTVGLADPRSVARVQVKADAEADRRAFDAIAGGTPVATLISGKVEKTRFDEATLMDEFRKGNLDAEPPPEPEPGTGATATPPPLVDRVLQRAVEINRALRALRRPAVRVD